MSAILAHVQARYRLPVTEIGLISEHGGEVGNQCGRAASLRSAIEVRGLLPVSGEQILWQGGVY